MRASIRVVAGLLSLNIFAYLATLNYQGPFWSNIRWFVALAIVVLVMVFLWINPDLRSPKTNNSEAGETK